MFGIPAYLIWLVIIILLAVIEASTMALVCIWFAAGAVVAMLTALIGLGFWPQIILFTLVSAICLAAVRPMAVRHLNTRKTATNADRAVGKEALVVESIDNRIPSGQVRVAGQMWTARAADDHMVIPEGTSVIVRQIQGVKLIVEPVEQPARAK
ncbi:MAG: NfeD family protein [Clostridia bacterium]|nr:NfeD family protein [Clostridia bacterium]